MKSISHIVITREKEGDLTQTYDETAIPTENSIQWTTQKRHQKLLLHNDYGPT